jgi:glutathione S-transferase
MPKKGDIPLTLYRDANAWCPHCHKVFWYAEQKRLRYTTERIHLQGDPREPRKQEWFLRDINPSGSVPVIKIRDEVLKESLDILRRLESDFPDDEVATVPIGDIWAQQILQACDYFDCDGDAWLQNLDEEQEEELYKATCSKFAWLEQQLQMHTSGPFFLGAKPSLLDAMYVGFLSRAATNYRFFKQFEVRNAGLPQLVAWLDAMQQSRGGQRTWQPPSNDQRIYQSHPARRAAAEPCQQIHPTRHGVREVSDWAVQLASIRPPPASEPLAAGSPAAMEAAHVLAERRAPIASFLLRKAYEIAAGPSYWQERKHPRAGGRDWEQGPAGGICWVGQYPPPYAPPDQKHRWPAVGFSQNADEQMAVVDGQLLLLAAVLAGLCSPADARSSLVANKIENQTANPVLMLPVLMLADTVDSREEGGSVCAGELLLAPAFMSAAAEAQVEAALEVIRPGPQCSAGAL